MARSQQTRDVVIDASRGRIYDRNGNVLALSAAAFSVWARPDMIRSTRHNDEALAMRQINNTAEELAAILDMDVDRVRDIITQDRGLIRITRGVKREEADMIRALRLRGIEIASDVTRYYPLGDFAAHILGSVTDDNNGLSGIELRYNRYLSGVPGRWIKNADRTGNRLSHGIERYFGAMDGFNVVLTIDEVIQHYVEQAIAEARVTTQADRVMAIVMDPQTGDILAMASVPDFDSNAPRVPLDQEMAEHLEGLTESERVVYWNRMWRNPLISDVYEPGSTFKIITAAMALEENLSSHRDPFFSSGTINVTGTVLNCWRRGRPHGHQTLMEAFGNSCNPAFVQLVQRVGITRFYHYLDLFGLTERTGIDFPGEALPIIQNRATAGPVGLATMSYGQGIAITPIQLVTAVAAIGNEGQLMQPRLVKALTDADGNVVEEFETRVVRQVLSRETVEEMRMILEYSVAHSGGGNARVPGFRVGGKTGTANQARGGVYLSSVDASFVGMAPMDDPQVVVLVVVDNPRGVVSGSLTAAPVAGQIIASSLRHLNVQPRFTQEELTRMNQNRTTVPNVTGIYFSEAVRILGNASLQHIMSPAHDGGEEYIEDFIVVDQHPRAGERMELEGNVFVYRE